MSNITLFRALSSPTRIKILKTLLHKDMHLSGLARELKISIPVVSRHIKILEKAELIDKKIYGNTYILKTKTNNLELLLEPFTDESIIEINKKKSIFEALKQLPDIEIKKVGKHYYISSVNGENGYFIYEINGKLPKKPIDEYIINKDVTFNLKKLVSIKKKKIEIRFKNTKDNNKKTKKKQ
ncbi:MAG: winged helix-turn-helix domain-containing protein [Candidatus Thermoplasmatota archaeon]|jgi:DNA-binding transcriptional ArsR family regulator|nr:winged helix-turn-helix domain-containing protein [Candidatus Thermoplasmatota archaeon]